MKKTLITSLLALLLAAAMATSAAAQTTVRARTGTGGAEYRFVEAIHQYESGVLTGAGYTDAGDPRNYTNVGGQQAVYGGGGYAFSLFGTTVQAIGFVQQNNGPEQDDAATSFVPWVLASRKVGPVVATGNYFAVTPADGDGSTTQVLEHVKGEYDFGQHLGVGFLAGVGYAGTKAGDGPWENRPFVTGTIKTPLGNFEVWGQRNPSSDVTFQIRYMQTF